MNKNNIIFKGGSTCFWRFKNEKTFKLATIYKVGNNIVHLFDQKTFYEVFVKLDEIDIEFPQQEGYSGWDNDPDGGVFVDV